MDLFRVPKTDAFYVFVKKWKVSWGLLMWGWDCRSCATRATVNAALLGVVLILNGAPEAITPFQ